MIIGGALIAFDFSIDGFDLLHDIVGQALIVFGLSKLRSVSMPEATSFRRIGQLRAVAIASLAWMVFLQLAAMADVDSNVAIETIGVAVEVAEAIAVYGFCWVMAGICAEWYMGRSLQSWTATGLAVLVLHTAPELFFAATGLYASWTGDDGSRFNLQLRGDQLWIFLLIVALILAPWIRIVLAMRTTIGELPEPPDW